MVPSGIIYWVVLHCERDDNTNEGAVKRMARVRNILILAKGGK
jgi:hypothetical protein